jgi:hypothetical protein
VRPKLAAIMVKGCHLNLVICDRVHRDRQIRPACALELAAPDTVSIRLDLGYRMDAHP